MAGGSVSFDRAAAYYDATRGRTPEGVEAETLTLVEALRGHGPVLEIGVGTGQIAIPVARAGVPVIGLDVSAAMLGVLVDKAGGRPPFPLLRGDATALPVRDLSMGAAMFRWVLHLIPSWPDAVAELVRVVRPGGVVLALLGGASEGPRGEIQERFAVATGVDRRPAGLDWEDYAALDEAFACHGAAAGWLPAFEDRETSSVEDFLRGLEENRYSWTWPIDGVVRVRAAREVRAWAEEEYGPLDAIEPAAYEVRWRAYRLP
ncbi:MAG TPA: class I SAM-dependent methyltransferase [Actinomycetota bacterium]